MWPEQPRAQIQTENFRSFDPLASVDLYSYDLLMHGHVLPETKARVYNEELSYIAEGINRPLFTEFVLEDRQGELVYFDRGEWVPYISSLVRAQEVASLEANLDSRRTFTAERAAEDLLIGYQLQALKPGEHMAWRSAFPKQEAKRYGDSFIGSLGYQPGRRMGFLYYAERLEDGRLKLQTQSVDNSDEEAFGAALSTADNGIVAMRETYDQVMSYKHGGDYYAGREASKQISKENAWQVIQKHQDLLKHYFSELENLARQRGVGRAELEKANKRLTYGIWATLRERMDKQTLGIQPEKAQDNHYNNPIRLQEEIDRAYRELARRGEVLFGCGGSITGEDALLGADGEQVFEAVFGGKNEILKCVTCPLCKRTGVDAHISHGTKEKTITCSKCRQSKVYPK